MGSRTIVHKGQPRLILTLIVHTEPHAGPNDKDKSDDDVEHERTSIRERDCRGHEHTEANEEGEKGHEIAAA